MIGRVTFEFELDGDATKSDYEQHVAEVATIMENRLVGDGFTTIDAGLRSYSFNVAVIEDAQ